MCGHVVVHVYVILFHHCPAYYLKNLFICVSVCTYVCIYLCVHAHTSCSEAKVERQIPFITVGPFL